MRPEFGTVLKSHRPSQSIADFCHDDVMKICELIVKENLALFDDFKKEAVLRKKTESQKWHWVGFNQLLWSWKFI